MTDDQRRPHSPSFSHLIPEGDDRKRLVCDLCGHIQYMNPKIVVGSVTTLDRRILMCRRAIEPRAGFWTLPAGYLEENETTDAGARREAREEACAEIETGALLAVYNIPRISQVQLFYRALLVNPTVTPGPESTEVALYRWQDIPWREIAFPSVVWALNHHRQALGLDSFPPFTNPPDQRDPTPVETKRR